MKGFLFALAGIKTAFQTEVSLRIHLVAAAVVGVCGWYFNLSAVEWILLVLCIGLVFVVELLNTAMEYLIDLVSPGYHPIAGKVKDIAAGAVLISAVTAIITGLIIFLPKIILQISLL